jgi:hypothetical protein
MKANLYEIDYSVSPGGINMWGLDVYVSLGNSSYCEFDTPAQALKWLINKYPKTEFDINVQTLGSYEEKMSVADGKILV